MGLLDLIGHKYPFTDFHELNLDWCITAILQLQKAFEDFSAGNKLIFADPLQHDLTKTYAKNTIVVDPVSGTAYLSLNAVPKGVQLDNADYWLPVFDFAGYVTRANQNFTDNYFSGTDRTPYVLLVGDWVVLDDVLYKVIVDMAADDLFIIGTNIVHFTVEQFLKDFITTVNDTLYQYSLTIQQYKDDIDASELAYRQQLAQDIADTTASLQAQLNLAISGATVDSEVINARLGANGVTYATLGTAIRTQVEELDDSFKYTEDELNSLYFKMRKNLVNPHKFVNGYLNSVGELIAGDSYRTTGFIYINKSGDYVKRIEGDSAFGNAAKNIYMFDASGTYIKTVEGTLLSSHWYTYTIANDDIGNFIRFSSGNTNERNIYFGLGDSSLDPVPPFNLDLGTHGFIDYTQIKNPSTMLAPYFNGSANMVNPSDLFNGYISYSSGAIVSDDTYRTTGLIKIEQSGDYMKHINAPSALGGSNVNIGIFDGSGNYVNLIAGTNESDGWFSYTISAEYIGLYVRFTSGNNSESDIYFGLGDTIPSPIPQYGITLNEYVKVDYSQITNIPGYDYKSALSDKVWYAIGDSATHGDFTGIIQPPLPDGIYAGELPVYPFYIGNRTGMIVHNLAVNGATMAVIDDQPTRYQWAVDEHYQSVDSDADYITIWIGANDMWQHVPIGTIDSNDDTTFYGAFNKVLTWYINNRPDAKLGLVASFWCNQTYAEAVIAIGAKYGIPVLNFFSDPNIPVSVGSQRADVSSTIKTLRDTQYRVSENNSHPSAKYHELESYFIEEWLKTL